MASNWLVGHLDYGKRIKCQECGRTHMWQSHRPINEERVDNLLFPGITYSRYGTRGNPHKGEVFLITGDSTGWLIKYRKRLRLKSNRGTRLYTEYIALCPQHARIMFGEDKIDDIDATMQFGDLHFTPISSNSIKNPYRILPGDLIARKEEFSEGHETNGLIGEVLRFEGAEGVAVVYYATLGERHCQTKRYDRVKVDQSIRMERNTPILIPPRVINSQFEEIPFGDMLSTFFPTAVEQNRNYLYLSENLRGFSGYGEIRGENGETLSIPRRFIVPYNGDVTQESQTTQETRTNNRAASEYTWGNVTQPTTPEEPVIVLQKGIWIHHNPKLKF